MPRLIDKSTKLMIRFALHGCTNRPFYHLVVIPNRYPREGKIVQQIGAYDPLPNASGEKVMLINFDRLNHYLQRGAVLSKPVAELLGLSGYLPIHPYSKLKSMRNKLKSEQELAKMQSVEEERVSEGSAV